MMAARMFVLHTVLLLLARDAFVRTNHRSNAMTFIRLSVWDGRAL